MTAENLGIVSPELAGSPPTYIHSRVTAFPAEAKARSRNNAVSVIEYGVATPLNNTVLIVTADRGEAEHALEWIPDGRVVRRTVSYSSWLPGSDGDLPTRLPRTG